MYEEHEVYAPHAPHVTAAFAGRALATTSPRAAAIIQQLQTNSDCNRFMQKAATEKPIRTDRTSFDHVYYQCLRLCSSRFSSDATSSPTATPPLIFLQPSSPVFHQFFSSSLPPVSLLQSSSSSHPPVLLLQPSSNSPLPVFLLLQLSSSSPTSSSFIFLPSEKLDLGC